MATVNDLMNGIQPQSHRRLNENSFKKSVFEEM